MQLIKERKITCKSSFQCQIATNAFNELMSFKCNYVYS